MDPRLALQIALGAIITFIVVLGGLIIYTLTSEAETVVVDRVVEQDEVVAEKKNPWEDKGEAAIALVKRVEVEGLESDEDKGKKKADDEEVAPTTVGQLLDDETFIKDKLKITSAEPVGWEATWWGETKHGPSFFLVRRAFQDANIKIGPTWLVDLKTQKVVPKNVLARVTENPKAGVESDYYDKAEQVVSAMTNHRFESGLNLGGALLLYFEQRADTSEEDTILGWTIDHDRGHIFEAFFQWVEAGEPTYAHFIFDYKKKALRAVNLQAANIMRTGEQFTQKERVSIMPKSYNPKGERRSKRWLGRSRKVCRMRSQRDKCNALDSILQEKDLIESVEWLLTAQADTPEDFEVCQEKHNCRWKPEEKGKDEYRVIYIYNLGKDTPFNPRDPDDAWTCGLGLKVDKDEAGEKGNCVAWDINLKSGDIKPVDHTSALAYRAIHPRS